MVTRLVLTIGMKREMIGQLMLAMVLGRLLERVILIQPILIFPWVLFMYSLAAQCIFIKIQILGEPGNMTDIRNALFPYLFREEYYEGLVPNNQHFTSNGAVPGPKSFKCRCYYPINCVPEDGYEVILQYDNKKGKTPITLTYTKTIGISLSAEVQASFSVSNTKTSSISHRFWWIFFQHFTVTQTSSQTTTYDWSVKVAADFSATTSLEAQITIQPGSNIFP